LDCLLGWAFPFLRMMSPDSFPDLPCLQQFMLCAKRTGSWLSVVVMALHRASFYLFGGAVRLKIATDYNTNFYLDS
jgi:hypothetical protein